MAGLRLSLYECRWVLLDVEHDAFTPWKAQNGIKQRRVVFCRACYRHIIRNRKDKKALSLYRRHETHQDRREAAERMSGKVREYAAPDQVKQQEQQREERDNEAIH